MTPPPRSIYAALLSCLVLSGCAGLCTRRLTLPGDYTTVRGQLLIHSDFPLPAQHRLLEDLSARRDDLVERLDLPLSDEPIHVYLFENADKFRQFVRLHHPRFPARRAFFLATDTRLLVYVQWGDHVAEDLRHEVTHAYLHSVVPNIPLWLDEGLAEYFEVPRGKRGFNQEHVEHLRARIKRGVWEPNLSRLESLTPARDMTGNDYAEAWAWVHFLLESPLVPRDLLRSYLRDLRRHGRAEPLSARLARLFHDPNEHLVAHVQQLAGMH